MLDRGFFLTWQAIRRQLAAMPHDLYLIRLIHHATHSAFPGERLWTAGQLSTEATVRFLRLRNRERFFVNGSMAPFRERLKILAPGKRSTRKS